MTTYRHYAFKKRVDNVNKDLKQLLIIWGLVILAGIVAVIFIDYSIAGAANRSAVCSPDVTCDPTIQITCPNGTDEIGRNDKGAPICKNQPTGCPYGDSIPLGPMCDKQAPVANVNQTVDPVNVATPDVNSIDYSFEGK